LPVPIQARLGPGEAGVVIEFWSADWTPWPVIAAIRRRWPAVHFTLHVAVADEKAAMPRPRTKAKARLPDKGPSRKHRQPLDAISRAAVARSTRAREERAEMIRGAR
jgi:hypothetical protein